jgi:dTDP-4-amino-4,6-dideoxygalactose transaminase
MSSARSQAPPARVPLLDLAAQHAPIADELRAAALRVLGSGRYVLGPELEAFEQAVADYLGVRHAVGVSSGTDALSCALMALDILPGDEVITSSFSFIAAAECIARLGAVPRLVDILPETFNIDPAAAERAIGSRTRAIVAVHLFGQPADLRSLEQLCLRHGLALVEDAAQAFGSELHDRKAGSWGNLGCFSFFPSKPLGGFGDGGMIVTSDAALARRCRGLRVHGSSSKYAHDEIGGNFRLDELQAALLRVKLPWVDRWARERERHARAYLSALGALPGVRLPGVIPGARSVWSSFTVRCLGQPEPAPASARDAVARLLAAGGIETAVHYPRSLQHQPALQVARADPTPASDSAAAQVLSLPVFPTLTEAQRQRVIGALGDAAGRAPVV